MCIQRLIVMFALVLCSVTEQAQTATLTLGQAAAIKAQEARENDGLGQFKYDSITFDVVRVTPAVKLTISPDPAPGTVAASVIEHLAGGKQPPANQGYRNAIYWLVPQPGGGWATGYIPGRGVVGWTDMMGTYPTKAEAEQRFEPPKEITVGEAAKQVGAGAGALVKVLPALIVGGFALLVVFGGPILYIRHGLKMGTVPNQVTCPGCRTVNYPQAGTCANCRSTNTALVKRKDKKGRFTIVTRCSACRELTQFDPYCVSCETNLTQTLLYTPGQVIGTR